MLRDESNNNEVETEINVDRAEVETELARSTAETMRITGEYPELAPDLFRFGRGRFREVEFVVKNPDHIFSIRSEDVHDIIIGREDPAQNYEPAIDLTDFGGKLFGVSRRHATLNNQNGLLFITDHSTTNGTFVNGKRIDPEIPHVLTHGDSLQIGKVRLTVKFTNKVLAI